MMLVKHTDWKVNAMANMHETERKVMKKNRERFTMRTVLLCLSLALTAWVAVPLTHALGTGLWKYPENSAERLQLIKEMEYQLTMLSEDHKTRMGDMGTAKKELENLHASIQAAEAALVVDQRPVTVAMEKYRKAQELSLVDPMITTEPQRMKLIKVKEELSQIIVQRQGEIDLRKGLLPQAQAKMEDTRRNLNAVLQQIETTIRHRDEVSELVFLKNVKD